MPLSSSASARSATSLFAVAAAIAALLAAVSMDFYSSFGNYPQLLLFLWFILASVAGVVFLFTRHLRRALLAFAMAGVSVVAVASAWKVGAWQEERARRRGDELAASLERHKTRTGRYPESLDSLVPREISEVADTGIGFLSKEPFLYEVEADGGYSLGYPSIPMFICWKRERGEWECVE